jgi:hypothetical protein
MPVGEKAQSGAGLRWAGAFSRLLARAEPRKPRRSRPTGLKFTAETDSPLEGTGFELSVPLGN